jgi:hypothetical protein
VLFCRVRPSDGPPFADCVDGLGVPNANVSGEEIGAPNISGFAVSVGCVAMPAPALLLASNAEGSCKEAGNATEEAGPAPRDAVAVPLAPARPVADVNAAPKAGAPPAPKSDVPRFATASAKADQVVSIG